MHTEEKTANLAEGSPNLLPLAEVARIDAQIAEYVHRAFAETGTTADMERLNALIRERAEASLPRALVERVLARRQGGSGAKSSAAV